MFPIDTAACAVAGANPKVAKARFETATLLDVAASERVGTKIARFETAAVDATVAGPSWFVAIATAPLAAADELETLSRVSAALAPTRTAAAEVVIVASSWDTVVARTVEFVDAEDVASARFAVRTGRIVTDVERSPVADESAFVAEPVTRMAADADDVTGESERLA